VLPLEFHFLSDLFFSLFVLICLSLFTSSLGLIFPVSWLFAEKLFFYKGNHLIFLKKIITIFHPGFYINTIYKLSLSFPSNHFFKYFFYNFLKLYLTSSYIVMFVWFSFHLFHHSTLPFVPSCIYFCPLGHREI